MNLSSEEHEFLRGTLLEIVEAESGTVVPPWVNTSQPLTRHILFYIDSGEGELAAGEQPDFFYQNSLFIFTPGTVVEMSLTGKNPRLYWIAFDMFRISESFSFLPFFRTSADFPGFWTPPNQHK